VRLVDAERGENGLEEALGCGPVLRADGDVIEYG
jgi:hypothetical protein